MKENKKQFGSPREIRSYLTGFTLVEVLIVVALLIVLVSMVLVATSKARVDKEEQLTRATIELLDSALQEYYDYTNNFPGPNSPSVSLPEPDYKPYQQHNASLCFQLNLIPSSKPVIEKVDYSQKTIINGYLVIVDAWGTPLNYLYVDGVDTFGKLISAGPDGDFATAADNIDNRK